jgi:hypothetical protein
MEFGLKASKSRKKDEGFEYPSLRSLFQALLLQNMDRLLHMLDAQMKRSKAEPFDITPQDTTVTGLELHTGDAQGSTSTRIHSEDAQNKTWS